MGCGWRCCRKEIKEETVEAAEEASEAAPAPKRKGKKKLAIAGVVVGAVVVLGAGLWATGDYEVVGENSLGQLLLEERSLDELASAWGADGDGFCLRAGCHAGDDGSVMTREGLAAKTAGLSEQFNPHREQHGEVACGECHKGRSRSVNYCTQCHAEAPVPDGWLTYSEAKKKAAA